MSPDTRGLAGKLSEFVEDLVGDHSDTDEPVYSREQRRLQDHLFAGDRDPAPNDHLSRSGQPVRPFGTPHNLPPSHWDPPSRGTNATQQTARVRKHIHISTPPAAAASPAVEQPASPEGSPAEVFEDSDEDTAFMELREGPEFEYGVSDDPLEYLSRCETACLGRPVPSSSTRTTEVMDMARKGCCRYLQRKLAGWTLPGMFPGGGGVSGMQHWRQANRMQPTGQRWEHSQQHSAKKQWQIMLMSRHLRGGKPRCPKRREHPSTLTGISRSSYSQISLLTRQL